MFIGINLSPKDYGLYNLKGELLVLSQSPCLAWKDYLSTVHTDEEPCELFESSFIPLVLLLFLSAIICFLLSRKPFLFPDPYTFTINGLAF